MPTLGFVKKFRKEFEEYIEGKRAGTPVMKEENALVEIL
jgi:NADH-quinone oxidoreductase subunit F